MQPDERLLFMEMQTDYATPEIRLPEEDIRMLVDAGIKTCISFCTNWDWIEPQKGVYNFDYYDRRVELLQRAGMKVYLQCQTWFPNWLPDEWKVKGRTQVFSDISPWNSEGWKYMLDFYAKMCERYNSSTVVVMNSYLTDGETFLPNELSCFDKAALEQYQDIYHKMPEEHDPDTDAWYNASVVRAYSDIQRVLFNNAYQEIWVTLHPALFGQYGNGTICLPQILAALRAEFPTANISQLFCTWRQWSGLYPQMKEWSTQFNTNIFGGAEYAEGVVTSVDIAKEQGIRGLLIGPTHPYTNHRRIEPWMLDNIRTALAKWTGELRQ
jgi:hypothetical protein